MSKRALVATDYGKQSLLSDGFAEDLLDTLVRNPQALDNHSQLLELVFAFALAKVCQESEADEVSLDEFSKDEISRFAATNKEYLTPAIRRVSELARLRMATIARVTGC
jgi:hypothetical protein